MQLIDLKADERFLFEDVPYEKTDNGAILSSAGRLELYGVDEFFLRSRDASFTFRITDTSQRAAALHFKCGNDLARLSDVEGTKFRGTKKKPAHFEVAKILDGALTLKVEKIFPPEGKLYFSIYGDENKFLAHDKIWSTRSRRRSAAGNSTQ